MEYTFPPDLAKQVQHFLHSGRYQSEDEVLRAALEALGQFDPGDEAADVEFQETVAAVREGIADMEDGRMRPLNELLDEARQHREG